MKQDFVSGADPESLTIMKKATGYLWQSNILVGALKAGDRAPEFSLEDAEGRSVSSQNLLNKGPLLITFYRGIW